MTQRLVRIASVAVAFVLGAAASRLPGSRAAVEPLPPPGVERILCEMRCDQRYHACVLMATILNTAGFEERLGRPTRGPAYEVPGTWPFTDDTGVDDRRANPLKDPNCAPLYDRCLVKKCGAKEPGQE